MKGNNLHRVVIYRDDADRAKLMEPFTMTPPLGSPDPRDLWKWMAEYEKKTAGQVLAIAHNGNMSNGIMFPEDASFGKKLDKAYVESSARWEPLYEVTQIKGDGETHPFLSRNDEFADYETWDVGNLDLSVLKKDEMLKYEYARSALKIGLQLEQRLGTNPYKFGMIGSTDSHTALAAVEEDNFFGKHSGGEPSKDRYLHPMAKVGDNEYPGYSMVASGLAAVWAGENTRASIFDAMKRKETYATTGSRIIVRFFGGWDFDAGDAANRLPARVGYEKGVPMGGNLAAMPEGKQAPTFLVAAMKDPMGGNLDRIQIVKGWLDGEGRSHEKVYDVAWSDERKPDPESGKLPPVGNTVDVANATWTNSIGDPELLAKRVFDLVKDFGTSESPKSTRSSTTHWCPGRPGHPAFRHNIASSLRLHTGLPYDWTPRSDAPLGSPLAPSARRVSRVASRLPGTTRLRFALHGGQRRRNLQLLAVRARQHLLKPVIVERSRRSLR